jgi:phage baseplate assembly protein W
MAKKYKNINYPFKDSREGHFLDLNEDSGNAIKADLMHLILTNKGERLYMPDFGTNLRRFIFEPNDTFTQTSIKEDIRETVKKYLPNLVINEVLVRLYSYR